MADEDVKGTSADAEEPTEDEQVKTPAEEAAETTADEPVAERPRGADEASVEEPTRGGRRGAVCGGDRRRARCGRGGGGGACGREACGRGTWRRAEEPGAAEAAPATGPKPKRKRLPRTLRPNKTRPTRVRSTERKPIVRLEAPDHERGRRQERQGKVVSDAMEKTIVVEVSVVKAHPKYKKVVRRSVKFHAHDERSEAKVGDLVRIVETRPLSRTKRWRLVEVVEAAK